MKSNNLIVSVSILLLVLFLSIGIATANENNTAEHMGLGGDEDSIKSDVLKDSDDFDEGYTAKIIARNTTQKYNGDNEVVVKIVDSDNEIIDGADVFINDHYIPTYDEEGKYYFYFDFNPGNHKLKITLEDNYYTAKPVFINLKILKSKFMGKIKCKTYWGTNKGKVTMKASAYDDELMEYVNGYITFKVNGKSYKVKTKNGVATKTIRIKKAGTFTYTAQFTNDKYSSSVVGKGKLYVYSTSKKARTFKIKNYKVVVPVNKYIKLVNVKNTGKFIYIHLKTNKYIKQTIGHSQYDLKTVNARVSMVVSYGGKNGGQYGAVNKYHIFLTTPYQGPGYDYCSPALYGSKKSSLINKVNSAKTTKW